MRWPSRAARGATTAAARRRQVPRALGAATGRRRAAPAKEEEAARACAILSALGGGGGFVGQEEENSSSSLMTCHNGAPDRRHPLDTQDGPRCTKIAQARRLAVARQGEADTQRIHDGIGWPWWDSLGRWLNNASEPEGDDGRMGGWWRGRQPLPPILAQAGLTPATGLSATPEILSSQQLQLATES